MGALRNIVSSTLISLGAILAFALVPAPAHAATDPVPTGGGGCHGDLASFLFLKSWDACLLHDSKGVPQISDLSDIWRIAVIIIEDMMKLAGYLAAGFLIWGGIKYQKSQGEPGETTQARQIINNALFGLVITLIAVAVINFIAGTFT